MYCFIVTLFVAIEVYTFTKQKYKRKKMLFHDSHTDSVCFSTLLVQKYPKISKNLFTILDKHKVSFELFNGTKDIWMRDYMPIQTDKYELIRYAHHPDYLIGYDDIRTNPKEIVELLHVKRIKDIPLNIDGGNIVRATDKIICTDKIFKANAKFKKEDIMTMLKNAFGISEVIIIPKQPYDMTGHSDGLVRFIDDNRVLVTSFYEKESSYEKKLIASLLKHNLEILTLPSTGYYKDKDGGVWNPYINYMQVGKLIILPATNDKADTTIFNFFKATFSDCTIESVDLTSIIAEGGALNCISWNIKKEHA